MKYMYVQKYIVQLTAKTPIHKNVQINFFLLFKHFYLFSPFFCKFATHAALNVYKIPKIKQ